MTTENTEKALNTAVEVLQERLDHLNTLKGEALTSNDSSEIGYIVSTLTNLQSQIVYWNKE